MRLRTRDLPSLQYFKTDLEPRLNLRSEEGALTFSLWKHTCLVSLGVLILAKTVDGETLSPRSSVEVASCSPGCSMMLCAYLIPQLLFRRTSGHWLNGLLPFLHRRRPDGAPAGARARLSAFAARHREAGTRATTNRPHPPKISKR